jgi:hypothetical protein
MAQNILRASTDRYLGDDASLSREKSWVEIHLEFYPTRFCLDYVALNLVLVDALALDYKSRGLIFSYPKMVYGSRCHASMSHNRC